MSSSGVGTPAEAIARSNTPPPHTTLGMRSIVVCTARRQENLPFIELEFSFILYSSLWIPSHRDGSQSMSFSQMRPKEVRTNSNVVAWNCDGKKLLSCGLERGCRGWPLDNVRDSPHNAIDD